MKIGAVLNGAYKVSRFIKRGGMGEIYEGINTLSSDRVAIKMMLAMHAEDKDVRSMFLREISILSTLSHPAIVGYRFATVDPSLGTLYCVTEFIDGPQLDDIMGDTKPTTEDIVVLVRRLAEGLAAAHEQKIFHRDLSPDNIMLPGGNLARAKIIDFGIAKATLGGADGTIYDGTFKGKFGYAAPEQLGDFGSDVGEWTDVYGLGLVALAFATGKPPLPFTNIAEAVDRRRAGVDVSRAPPELQPILRAMLAAEPAKRLRSMEAVLRELDKLGKPKGLGGADRLKVLTATAATTVAALARGLAARAVGLASAIRFDALPRPALVAGGAGLLLLVLVLGAMVMILDKQDPPPVQPPPREIVAPTPSESVAEVARKAAEGAMPQIDCSWLDITEATSNSGAVALTLSGAALDQVSVSNAIQTVTSEVVKPSVVSVDTSRLNIVTPAVCGVLNAFRIHRDVQPNNVLAMSSTQTVWERETRQPGCVPQTSFARPVIEVAADSDFTLLLLSEDGYIEQAIVDRNDAGSQTRRRSATLVPSGSAGDKFTFAGCRPEMGKQALVLVKGAGPFDLGIRPHTLALAPRDFGANFDKLAAANGWKVQMLWYGISDTKPDQVVPPDAMPPPRVASRPPSQPPSAQIEVADHAPPADSFVNRQPDISVAEPTDTAPGKKAPCQKYDTAWTYLGDMSLNACIRSAFSGQCSVHGARSGDVQLRRYNGNIQRKGVFGWSRVAKSDCPAS
ncbi:hypothetical protein CFHF_04050 [Caulobacter flavus]|uniref:Protein kinase domain-containing protein n=1 Tax=Caulobacter flavus TaxID=1679497 RepID=A0A2N5CZE7_9CAUL|nr:serine/threonine-protein kinase [Caulobacter flavus]AYV45131.1 hypothetical protein C1707_02120 [Caulobacter flavus]PLR19189.1 hypothetical protein CFHF_04050 [Caulobacter flavus]